MDNQTKMEIPKTVFDKEYSTQWKREVKFLEDKGINYVYAKRHYKYPVTRYKYTKTPELFLALAEFYNQVRIEHFFKDVEKTTAGIEGTLTKEDPVVKTVAEEVEGILRKESFVDDTE